MGDLSPPPPPRPRGVVPPSRSDGAVSGSFAPIRSQSSIVTSISSAIQREVDNNWVRSEARRAKIG
eukprot:11452926-Alexandrium_andersonii.AAC.1